MSWHFSQEPGGGILGGTLLGWTTVGAVEIEKYPRECLLQRQRDGLLPPFPVWDDVCTFNGNPWRGLVGVVSGGFPCQDISSAGKGAGITGARSSLWKEMHRIICEVRPRYAFMENSPMLTSRGLGTVLGDLAESGYNAAWLVLGAADVGAPHIRKRIWILAEEMENTSAHTHMPQRSGNGLPWRQTQKIPWPRHHGSGRATRHPWSTEPNVGGSLNGLADKLDKNKHLSNEAKEHGKKILRNLWKGTFPQEIREAFRGFPSISEEEILLAILCQYNEESNSICIQVESGTAPQTELRNLWRVIEAARTSHQWEHSGQFTREYSDALRIVSHQAPSLYTEAWINGSWESGISRVTHGVASRVDRLKAIGNGQVPLVAATAFLKLRDILDNA